MNSKSILQRAIGLIIVVWLMVGCGSASSEPMPAATPISPTLTPVPPTPTPVPPTPTPILEGLVDVGGHSLNIQCKGEGSPTVIFESSSNMPGNDWTIVHSKVGELTRACYYDRAGLGKSDPYPEASCTTQDMVNDLHTLLANANIAGPYVLAARGIGSFNTRLYASQYPQDVVGMVLVHVSHPDMFARALALFPPESPDDGQALKMNRQFYAGGYNTIPEERSSECLDYDASAAQVRATGSLGDIPLIVLTVDSYGLPYPLPGFPPELLESLRQDLIQMHQELAALSSNSKHIIVEDSGGAIHWDQWELVVDTIGGVVIEVRGE